MPLQIRTLLFGILVFFAAQGKLLAVTEPIIEDGKQVTLAYQLFSDGNLIETTDAKKPFIYTHGEKKVIAGLEKGVAGLHVGERVTVRLAPDEAYGAVDPKAFQEIERSKLPPEITPEVGAFLEARDPQGNSVLVRISEVKEKTVVVDFNHPLAGKNLEFQIEVLNIQ